MTISLDPRPITSFNDLVERMNAPIVETRQATLREALLGVLVWMPLLMFLMIITWLVCAAYWWSRYLDEAVLVVLGIIKMFFGT